MGIGCSAWQTVRIATRETFFLARSLSPVHIILRLYLRRGSRVNVMVIFVCLVLNERMCVPYALPYGFTLYGIPSRRLSPQAQRPHPLPAPHSTHTSQIIQFKKYKNGTIRLYSKLKP